MGYYLQLIMNQNRLAELSHPPIFSLHDDDSTIGGPHPVPGAVFNINLLIEHSSKNPVRAPLREGADAFEYVNNLDVPRTLKGGEIGKFASACLNPLSAKIGDLVDFSPMKTMHQYRRHEAVYDGLEALTGGAYGTVRNREELAPMLSKGKIAMVRHIEGLHLPEDPRLGFQMVDRMIESGVRSVGIMWNEPTALATTCYYERKGMEDNGLSAYGKDVLNYLMDQGVMIDLSHSSPNTMRDILKMAPDSASILATHIASRRLTDHARNIYPDIAQEVAKRGKGDQKGLVGVPFVRSFVLRSVDVPVSVWDVVGHIQDFRQLLGSVDNIGLGPDFGGTMSGSRIPGLDDIAIAGTTLSAALRETKEFTEADIAKIFSGNAINYLSQNLPAKA